MCTAVATDDAAASREQSLTAKQIRLGHCLHECEGCAVWVAAGDEAALYLVGLLKGKASITLLKVTPRLSLAVMQQMSALLEDHQRTAKATRGGKKKKKAVV